MCRYTYASKEIEKEKEPVLRFAVLAVLVTHLIRF